VLSTFFDKFILFRNAWMTVGSGLPSCLCRIGAANCG
jgi:hypothetical protein